MLLLLLIAFVSKVVTAFFLPCMLVTALLSITREIISLSAVPTLSALTESKKLRISGAFSIEPKSRLFDFRFERTGEET